MHLQAGTPGLQTLFLYPLPEDVTLNSHCLDFRPPRNGSASALSVSGCLGDLYNSVFNMTIRLLTLEQKEVTHAIPDSAPGNVLVSSAASTLSLEVFQPRAQSHFHKWPVCGIAVDSQ